jgi:CubicO group peptidase (beta-lactamase class C family)
MAPGRIGAPVPSRSAPVAFKNVGVIRAHQQIVDPAPSGRGTIRRITGKTLKEFVREEIAGPLGADIQIGARAEDDDRIAELVPPPPLDVPLDAVPEDHPMRKTFSAPPLTPETAEAANTIAWRRADIGASNGHGNARSLARALSPISLNGKGVQLLSPDTIDLIVQEQAASTRF